MANHSKKTRGGGFFFFPGDALKPLALDRAVGFHGPPDAVRRDCESVACSHWATSCRDAQGEQLVIDHRDPLAARGEAGGISWRE